MKVVLFIFLGLVAILSFVLSGTLFLTGGRSWTIARHYPEYRPAVLKVENVVRDKDGDSPSGWRLIGSINGERVKFGVSAAEKDRVLIDLSKEWPVWQNPGLSSAAYQGRSANVVFDADWKPEAAVRKNAAWMTGGGCFFLLATIGSLVTMKFLGDRKGPSVEA